jgi:5-formyltetrahydrofolate cyclo-ligase
MTAVSRAEAARLLEDQVLALVRRHRPSTITAYVPIGSEPGGAGLAPALAAVTRVLLPVLLPDNDLDWAEYTGRMTDGERGLREPTGPRLGVDALTRADLILVPALAVDPEGNRMGRGGGSYDRALARLPDPGGPPVVALLHDGELIEKVPAEPHDRPVDGTITPHGGFTLTARSGLSRAAEWTK